MFTGLVRAVGRIEKSETVGDVRRVTIAYPDGALGAVAVGDSISVSGVCLTALQPGAGVFAAELSPETLVRTALGGLQAGDAVNLEPSLTAGASLGGHLVTGHVDAVSTVLDIGSGAAQRWEFALPPALSRFVAEKGSVAVDGVSLTVNGVDDRRFWVTLIPHTLAHTTFGSRLVGAAVNIEVDLVARYVDRLLNRG